MLKKGIFERIFIVSFLSVIVLISNPNILMAQEVGKNKIAFTDKIFENNIFRISLDSVEVLTDGRLKFDLMYTNLSKKILPMWPTITWSVQRTYLVDESGNEYDFIKSFVILKNESREFLANSDIKYKASIIFPKLIHPTKSLSLFSTYYSEFSDHAFYVMFKNIRLRQILFRDKI